MRRGERVSPSRDRRLEEELLKMIQDIGGRREYHRSKMQSLRRARWFSRASASSGGRTHLQGRDASDVVRV
jgi:hypothetical protein